MKNWHITAALIVALLTASPACLSGEKDDKAADKEKEKASIWMKQKLQLSQNILAGLTQADFDKIGTNAKALNFATNLEKWLRADKEDYKKQVTFFDMANKELIRQADKKNLEGATLTFNQLTVSCVQCHKIMRDAK